MRFGGGLESSNGDSSKILPRNDFRTNEHSFSHTVPKSKRGTGCKPRELTMSFFFIYLIKQCGAKKTSVYVQQWQRNCQSDGEFDGAQMAVACRARFFWVITFTVLEEAR
jgi:hypothetical protein